MTREEQQAYNLALCLAAAAAEGFPPLDDADVLDAEPAGDLPIPAADFVCGQ
jgi:hypothetical protein